MLLNDSGQVVAQYDSQPFLNQRLMQSWQPGETVYDPKHLRPVNGRDTIAPGTYQAGVVVYRQTADGFERLQTRSGDDLFLIGEMVIE